MSISSTARFELSDDTYRQITVNYSTEATIFIKQWRNKLSELSDQPFQEQLFAINRFFNRLEFKNDIDHWGQDDYWATPVEFLATQAGDCEDYSIAKYFSLIELGIPAEKLRLIYVTALRPRQAHMVLGYYETPTSIPLILDNINKRILPANQRRDLIPIYSFNGDGLWLAKSQGRGRQVQSGGNNSLWEDLNARMKQGN